MFPISAAHEKDEIKYTPLQLSTAHYNINTTE